MFQLSTLTKQRLRELTEPVVAVGKDEKHKDTPLAVIVPYEMYLKMEAAFEIWRGAPHLSAARVMERLLDAPDSGNQNDVVRNRNGA